KYRLVIASLATQPGPYPVVIRTEAGGAVSVPVESTHAGEAWLRWNAETRRWIEAARLSPGPDEAFAPIPTPPSERVFYLFIKKEGFADPAGYVAVSGRLAAVGRRCQVYVDRDHSDRDGGARGMQPAIDDVVRTFDDEVYPK